ncbi:hypothetical protein QBC42DRAFT_273239 [Cladorrhinum samala]|uniref:Uncharacterized protein n=1 Tax=Cladorrhinum samala TaxID=585594 RepID=A0AAV9HGS1_9PEZI|nr:hypothetical protein QBC42DRAFT_273239 [Cladorrhinum samala]
MVIKRKRSDSGLESFNSSVGTSSFNFDAMSAMDTARRGFFSPRLDTPSQFHSRTMKRLRDNRPSEEIIHQRTLNLLYSAQHQPNQPAATPDIAIHPTPVAPQTPCRTAQAVGPQQRSLHSFWNIPSFSSSTNSSPSRSSRAASYPPLPAAVQVQQCQNLSATCEDCGACLKGDSSDGDGDMMMDVDMDIDASDNVCGACGKAVCCSCSVSNLGEHRRCLVCAGSRTGNRKDWLSSVDVF